LRLGVPEYIKTLDALKLKGEDKKVAFDGHTVYEAINMKEGALRANRWLKLKRNFVGVEVALPKTVGDIVRTMSDLANIAHRKENYPNEYGLSLYIGDTGKLRATIQRGGGALNADVKPVLRVQFPDGEKAQNLGILAHTHIDGPPQPSAGDYKYMQGLKACALSQVAMAVLAVPTTLGVPLFSVFGAGGASKLPLDLVDKMPLEALFTPYQAKLK
jgi:hypothetical protein